MKKKLLAIGLALILILLCACQTKKAEPQQSEPESVETTEVVEITTEPEPEPDPEFEAAQAFAEKYLTKCSNIFINPLSIQVHKAWYYKNILDEYLFTFQLSVTNRGGNTETVYYGDSVLGFDDLSDEELERVYFDVSNGIGSHFSKDGIEAMQNGIELDAEAIQEYFLKHYEKP